MNKYECVVRGALVGSIGWSDTHRAVVIVEAVDRDSAIMAALKAVPHLERRTVVKIEPIQER